MKAAAAYSEARRGTALLIIQDGKTVFESYPGNHSARETHKIYSGTKGFWMLAALAAEEEGILNLNERVAETIDEWRKGDRKARITVRELLNFTCGLEPMSRLHGDTLPNRNAVALRLPVVAAPGERFIYGPAPLQVFDELFRRKLALHRETPTHYRSTNELSATTHLLQKCPRRNLEIGSELASVIGSDSALPAQDHSS